MVNDKLIKSFFLLEDTNNSKKGDVFTMCTNQGTIPINDDVMRFRNQSNGEVLDFKWFTQNKFIKAMPCDFFNSMNDKFDHITN